MAKDREVDVRTLVRVWMFWFFLPVLGGCVNNEPRPTILYDYGPAVRSAVQPRIWVPPPPKPTEPSYPGGWVPARGIERRWKAIVIHHSDTDRGNVAMFDEEHKSRGWEGVGYDFVIGNGSGSGDGEVEVTFRWRQQKTGAHCKTPNNWANEEAVGICLVGNLEQRRPTRAQMQALEELVEFLQRRYGIPKTRIYGHRNTPGARPTECPGRNFPMARFKSMLAF
jgi:N-acetylmuramoyl-L-alanine amidase